MAEMNLQKEEIIDFLSRPTIVATAELEADNFYRGRLAAMKDMLNISYEE